LICCQIGKAWGSKRRNHDKGLDFDREAIPELTRAYGDENAELVMPA
jgi:hypothetical protein